ncbi:MULTISPECIES: hypothetical protein [Alcanivorax]|jgi:hypothetical protein|uniref:Lipoprotein n=1 Tax=Alcanivorax hongdengensis A-11-3 TaxID=1177179 RepID=L0WAK3_9GAMM|nr:MULTISPECIES: hypothetical protein [Alcanivorax]EKF74029.1 hypothetical protein A11A3_11001 [Alcanivorax hongdengensis A-11-3]MDF1639222.1 hypothetical protein [Alcanivorax jadensis]
MNQPISIALLVFSLLSSGCSDDPMNKVKGEFLAGCTQSAPTEMCRCAFNKLAQQYSIEELQGFSQGRGNVRRFYTSVAKAGVECR